MQGREISASYAPRMPSAPRLQEDGGEEPDPSWHARARREHVFAHVQGNRQEILPRK